MTIYEADWICPVSSPPIRNGAIAVENGRMSSATRRHRRIGVVVFRDAPSFRVSSMLTPISS